MFYDDSGEETLINEETIGHIEKIFAKHGSDAWWKMSVEELLPESYRGEAGKWTKGADTMDVWFDSGSSWAGVVGERENLHYPADVYLEGSDQHRGWFQVSRFEDAPESLLQTLTQPNPNTNYFTLAVFSPDFCGLPGRRTLQICHHSRVRPR